MTPDELTLAVQVAGSLGGIMVGSGVGYLVGAARRGRELALAWRSEREAAARLREAEAVWSRDRVEHERVLGVEKDRVVQADRVSSHAQGEVEAWTSRANTWERSFERAFKECVKVAAERESLRTVLAASYVRVGRAYKLWRADGEYGVPMPPQTGVEGSPAGETARPVVGDGVELAGRPEASGAVLTVLGEATDMDGGVEGSMAPLHAQWSAGLPVSAITFAPPEPDTQPGRGWFPVPEFDAEEYHRRLAKFDKRAVQRNGEEG